jgi:hypothetical protein
MKGYVELNDILVANGVSALDKAWSSWQNGYWWAENMVVRVAATQPCDILIQRRGSDGTLGSEILGNSLVETPSGGTRAEIDYPILVGMSFRVGIKNNGGAEGDYKMSVMLMG